MCRHTVTQQQPVGMGVRSREGGKMFPTEETADAKAQRYVEQGVVGYSDVPIQQLFLALIPGSDVQLCLVSLEPSVDTKICRCSSPLGKMTWMFHIVSVHLPM